ncbi:putative uncharacterized phage protein [Moritella viscosa]|nr:hypothetical protein [Moritella viscosa]CED59850.1 putative uncharacterized phage protein [Moritella viscosa]SHO03556.1 Carbohydrate binding family 6 [Moritella viscosa]
MKLSSGKGSTMKYASNWDVATASITTQIEGVTALSGFEVNVEVQEATLLETGAQMKATTNVTYGDVEVAILADGLTDQWSTLHALAISETPVSILCHFSTGKGYDVEANAVITKVSPVTETGALNAYTLTLSVSGIPAFTYTA